LQDVFREVARALGVGNRVPGLHALLVALRDASLRRSAAIVAIGERMRATLLARGGAAATTYTIPNWIDAAAIAPVARGSNPLRAEWGLEDEFVVGYSGNLGRVHALDGLLEAASLLVERRDIVFLFVGSGAQREYLEHEAQRRRLANLRFQPYQPRGRLSQSLSVPDVHVVSLKPEVEGLVVPSKLYAALAVGRPVLSLGASDGEVSSIVKDRQCGIVCAPDDGRAIATAIERLACDADWRERFGANARAAALEFDRELAFAQWTGVLERLAREARPAPVLP
jgi:glycosyltransferase involved in cell wall biosynthesis